MPGDYDAGDVDFSIGTRVIQQFDGSEIDEGGETTFNAARSGKAAGFNRQSAANTASGTVYLLETSPDREYLDELARSGDEFIAQAKVVRHLERYDVGQPIGWRGVRCVLNKSSKQFAREGEAQTVGYPILVIGYEDIYKAS